jgi:hypothetical protein
MPGRKKVIADDRDRDRDRVIAAMDLSLALQYSHSLTECIHSIEINLRCNRLQARQTAQAIPDRSF